MNKSNFTTQTSGNGVIFFIGPRKTGTTSIYEVIRHGGLPFPAHIKETFFFEQVHVRIEEYTERYKIDSAKPFGEISPSYFSNEIALSNLQTLFPLAKIVITLRDPVSRAISAVQHAQRLGMLPTQIDLAAAGDNKHIHNIILGSSYHVYAPRWAAAFPGRVIQLKQDPDGKYSTASLHRLGELLELDVDVGAVSNHRANPARVARSPSVAKLLAATKRQLRRVGAFETVRTLKFLEPLFFSSNTTKMDIAPELKDFFRERLKDSSAYYYASNSVSIL